MKKNLRLLYLLLFSLLAACRPGFRTVYLSIEPGSADFFRQLQATHPLPRGYRYQNTDPQRAALTIRLENLYREEVPSRASAATRTLAARWFAPAAELEANLADVAADPLPPGVSLLPLEEINLPLKALSWQGLYPGDEQYPLVERTILSLGGPEGRVLPEVWQTWLTGLPGPTPPDLFWIGAVGDIMPGEGAQELFLTRGAEAVFTNTLPLLQRVDLMLGNLEAPATEHDTQVYKSFNYKFAPPVLEHLKLAGFDYFSLANNHCYDYGETGFRDTLRHLRTYRLPTSGVGLTPATAAAPWYTKIKNQPLALLSVGAFPVEWTGFDGRTRSTVTSERAGMLWVDEAGFAAMARAFGPDTLDIVMIHGGWERTLEPHAEQINTYRHCIELGADLVIGSHPHTLQGLEVYKGKLIAYSLGNFIFPDEVSYPYATESAILSLGVFRGRVKYIKIYPVKMQGTTATLDPAGTGRLRLLERTANLRHPARSQGWRMCRRNQGW